MPVIDGGWRYVRTGLRRDTTYPIHCPMSSPSTPCQDHLPDAVQRGLTNESVVDAAALRVLASQIRLGLFDERSPYNGLDLGLIGAAEHATLARVAATQSFVLLKNDGNVLPLAARAKIAFIGPHARSTLDLLGNDYMNDNKAVLKQSPLAVALERGLSVSYAAGCNALDCGVLCAVCCVVVSALCCVVLRVVCCVVVWCYVLCGVVCCCVAGPIISSRIENISAESLFGRPGNAKHKSRAKGRERGKTARKPASLGDGCWCTR